MNLGDPIVTFSPPAIAICGGIGAILIGAIGVLYRTTVAQLTERCNRAERQVDTLLPAVTQLTGAVERLGDKL